MVSQNVRSFLRLKSTLVSLFKTMFLQIDNKRHILFLPDSFVREEEQLEGLDFSTSV